MLGLEEVTYTFATIQCSWPNCTNRISFKPGPADIDREQRELTALRKFAVSHEWRIDDNNLRVTCPHHNQKENK